MILTRILDMRAQADACKEFAGLVRQRGPLILSMTTRDLKDRYAGQALGVAWAVLAPLLTMAVYLMVFTFIFKGRIGGGDDGSAYTAYLLSGLVPWMALQDILSRATTAITGQANLVKQIVFPSEILPLRVALAALPTMAIGLAVTIPVTLWSGQWSVFGLCVLLPLCVLFFIIMTAGISFWLAAIGVFLRDLKDIITFFLSIALFLHPILYPPGAGPGWLQALFFASPISYVLWCFRDALVTATPQLSLSWVVYPLASVVIFASGWRGFRMLKPSFGNVL